jgi:hypothetical protein
MADDDGPLTFRVGEFVAGCAVGERGRRHHERSFSTTNIALAQKAQAR